MVYFSTILGTILFFGFIIFNVFKFGILNSYSAYSTKWREIFPKWNINLWSLVTIISAFLVMPQLIQTGINSHFQFLGFFMPVYLIAVGLTPNWESNKKEHILHSIFALLCAVAAVIWIYLFKACYVHALIVFILTLIASLISKTTIKAYCFWLEMLIFLITFGSLFL